ncbi:hypothetical protein F4821DRAFT_222667, partial [Hypoxylon rubiginosum]
MFTINGLAMISCQLRSVEAYHLGTSHSLFDIHTSLLHTLHLHEMRGYSTDPYEVRNRILHCPDDSVISICLFPFLEFHSCRRVLT